MQRARIGDQNFLKQHAGQTMTVDSELFLKTRERLCAWGELTTCADLIIHAFLRMHQNKQIRYDQLSKHVDA